MGKKKRSGNTIRKPNQSNQREMSDMPPTNEKIIAILCADLHLSPKPPIWRSAEPDWYEAMKRPLGELRGLHLKYDECPILCAGDIFDKWNSPPELINFALEYLPDQMYCIPGQHDLPDHNYHEIVRSAYWTLVKAGKIKNIKTDWRYDAQTGFAFRGFPFGSKLKPCTIEDSPLKIALIHEYRWIKGSSYPGAPVVDKLSEAISKHGYDVIVYGDNHKGFIYTAGDTIVFNCGSLMRRHSDEIDYRPQVGLLLESGKVVPHFLDISADKYIEGVDDSAPVEEMDMSEFIEELKKLGETGLEFVQRVERFFKKNKTKKVVQKIIRKGMEE